MQHPPFVYESNRSLSVNDVQNFTQIGRPVFLKNRKFPTLPNLPSVAKTQKISTAGFSKKTDVNVSFENIGAINVNEEYTDSLDLDLGPSLSKVKLDLVLN